MATMRNEGFILVLFVSVIVKLPVLPPHAVDGHSRNPLYYDYYFAVRMC